MEIEDAERYFAKICRAVFAGDHCTPQERARRLRLEIEALMTSEPHRLSVDAKLKDISPNGSCKVCVPDYLLLLVFMHSTERSAIPQRKILEIVECFETIDRRRTDTNPRSSKPYPRLWQHQNDLLPFILELMVCKRKY
jgi:hypothetical protein